MRVTLAQELWLEKVPSGGVAVVVAGPGLYHCESVDDAEAVLFTLRNLSDFAELAAELKGRSPLSAVMAAWPKLQEMARTYRERGPEPVLAARVIDATAVVTSERGAEAIEGGEGAAS